jgi:hypothetical protein
VVSIRDGNVQSVAVDVSIVALLWVLLYQANAWVFTLFEVTPFANWVFLPAALRVVAVLLLGWRGVAGLFVGALFTNDPVWGVNGTDALVLSAISALAPWLGVWVSMRLLPIRLDLAGLKFGQLLQLSVICALTSVVAHHAFFLARDSLQPWSEGFVPMLAGDLIGTLLVLYLSAVVARRLA